MSFEEMAESAKSAGLPTEFKFDQSPVRVVMKERRAMVRGQGHL